MLFLQFHDGVWENLLLTKKNRKSSESHKSAEYPVLFNSIIKILPIRARW